MSLFVFQWNDDGDQYLDEMTKEELEKDLAVRVEDGETLPEFLSKAPEDMGQVGEAMMIFEGPPLIPKPVKVAERFEI